MKEQRASGQREQDAKAEWPEKLERFGKARLRCGWAKEPGPSIERVLVASSVLRARQALHH